MVTVIIPTLNAGRNFTDLLACLKEQTVKPVQIIIVNSGPDDSIVRLADGQNYKLITINPLDFDHGSSRNLAASYAKTEFIVFLTQDITLADEKTIEKLIEPMQADPNIAICYGRQLPRPDAGPLESFYREFNYPQQSILKTKDCIKELGLKTFFCSNCCSAIRLSIFNSLGGFKNGVIVNEDMLFAARAIDAGYAVYYNAEAKVYHSHSYSLIKTFRRYFNIGRFFADNRWLFQYTGLKNYGATMLRSGIKTFWEKKAPHHIAFFLTDLTVKTISCKLGWFYQLLFHRNRV